MPCALSDLDISMLRFIHHNRVAGLDNILYYISFTSTFISIGLLLAILITALIKRSKPFRVVFYKMLAVLIIAATFSLILKTIFIKERPFKSYPDIEKLSEAGNSSFPSGHTLEAFAIAVSFSILVPKKKYFIPIYIWASLVAYTRMALGVHYPSDVLSGIIIGAIIGWLVPWVIDKMPKFKKKATNNQ